MRVLISLLMLAACAYARTATRTPAVTTAITGLTDKDARHKAMVHPAFASAGQRAGLELWRIEDFNPVAVPQSDVGKFYKGDSYIVLKTSADKRNNLSWDIHYWIGSASTQDEAGAAAILTVGLDDKFGGAAIQHRETLGHESPQFLGYFRPDKDHDIYVYVGARAKNVEKLKAISVANQIRDQDHNGRGREKTEAMSKAQQYLSAKNYPSWVHVSRIPQGTEPAAFKQYFSTWRDVGMSHSRIVRSLSGEIENLDMVKAYDSSAPGTEAGKRFGELYQGDSYVMKYKYDADGISNYVVYYWLIYGTKAGEDMRAEQVPEVTTSLNPDDVFLLETPNKVYTSSQVEKDEAVHFVHRILGADRQFQVITQGSEPDDFFSYLNGDASQISSTESWRELVTRRLGTEARLFDADIFGDNTVSFEEIFNIKQSELHSDDAYVLDTGDELYVWIGKDTTNHLLGTRGPLTQSGSHDYHNSSKTLFFGNVAQDGILCWRTDKPLTMNVNLLCHLRKTAGVHCLLLISLYNNVPMGMERVGNRLFISLPRRRYGIPTTLNYIDLDQNVNTRSPALNPYPDILQGRNLTSVYRTRADECGRLWMVDTGLLELPVNPIQIQPPAIVVFDLNTDSQIFRYQFKSTDIPAANTPTGLASITVDVIGGDCSNTFAYVPDLTTFGIIVFSLRDNDSWRLSHNFFSFNPTAGALNIAGHRFQWSDGIFSITLREPEANGCRTAYFHALVSTQEFAVNTCLLRNRTASSDSNYWQMYRAPKIVKNQRVIETSIGNLLIFSCKLRNDSPAAKIKWKFKSIQSKKYVDIKPPAVEDPFVINKVIIASVSKKDVGSYNFISRIFSAIFAKQREFTAFC
ncbi:hypothetical protein MSG28_016228 [Choristoneura fumiferana]|uniref:Uncharacterized protein n=1 Tax=Choristoneura fumiferana TaxID=7141 RepID=A0ACC0K5Z8_CHOFU|nr:hypothetical protein MSG28_016228 [Choristoneura fumiferana]